MDYTIDEYKAIAIGRYGVSVEETKTMTLYEFGLYGLAYQVKKQDMRSDASYQAWQNQNVQSTKGKGKNVRSAYKKFNDFYDTEKDFESIFVTETQENKRRLSMAERNRRLNKNRGE